MTNVAVPPATFKPIFDTQQHIKFPIRGEPVLTNSLCVLFESRAGELEAEWVAQGHSSLLGSIWAVNIRPQDYKWLKDRLSKSVQDIKRMAPDRLNSVLLVPRCGPMLRRLQLSHRTANALNKCLINNNNVATDLTLGHIVSEMGAGSVCEFLAVLDRSVGLSAWLSETVVDAEAATGKADECAIDAGEEFRTLIKSVVYSHDDADLLWQRFVYSTRKAPTLEELGRKRTSTPVTKARAQQIEKAAEKSIRVMKVSLPHLTALRDRLMRESGPLSRTSLLELVVQFWHGDPIPSAQSLLRILRLFFPLDFERWEVAGRDEDGLVHQDWLDEARFVRETIDKIASETGGVVDTDDIREQLRTLGRVVRDSAFEDVVNGEQLVWLDVGRRWIARATRGKPSGTAVTSCRKMLSVCDSATVSELINGFQRDISRGPRRLSRQGILALLANLDEYVIEGNVVRAPGLKWKDELDGIEFQLVAELLRNGGRASGKTLMEALRQKVLASENSCRALLYWSPCIVNDARGQHALIGIRNDPGWNE